jgi:uncharacterized protein
MKVFVLRLKPNIDLKKSLKEFVHSHQIKAGIILTTVGSLKQAKIRFAACSKSTLLQEKFEIISLVGTLSIYGLHLHISVADRTGKTIGGHLDDGCLIYTTAEIAIGEIEESIFTRKIDEETGFKELFILPR